MDYTVPGILQARILDWVIFPFSRGSSQSRDWTQVSCTEGRFFTSWATREAQIKKSAAKIRPRIPRICILQEIFCVGAAFEPYIPREENFLWLSSPEPMAYIGHR